MIKSALIGVWVCAVTTGSAFLGTNWDRQEATSVASAGRPLEKLTQVKIKPLNIPVVSGGKVTGYIICQLAVLAPSDVLKSLSFKPDVFILDAAYNGIYSGDGIAFIKHDRDSWPAFAKFVKDAVNARFGMIVIHDVLIEEFGFLPADVARKGMAPLHPATVDKPASLKKTKDH